MPPSEWPETIPIPEATLDFLSPDIKKTTRTDFTDFFQRFRHAEDAHPAYRHLFLTHQKLAKLLIDHPAMQPNLQQTFSTPANSKNKVYFVWDSTLRTFQFLAALVDPQDPFSSPAFDDVIGRTTLVKQLILDDTGKLEAMNANLGYSDDDGIEFGDEILEVARTLEVPEGCAGCGASQRPDGGRLLVCKRCQVEKYCSVVCQKMVWKVHKRTCVEAA